MTESSSDVAASLRHAQAAAHTFLNAPAPNELINEFDHDAVKKKVEGLVQELDATDRVGLIVKIDVALGHLQFPALEHATASRGVLIAKLQGLELLAWLQDLKNSARALGYMCRAVTKPSTGASAAC